MAKTSKKSPEEKLRVVLSVLRGELSAAAAGRRAGVSACDWLRGQEGRTGVSVHREWLRVEVCRVDDADVVLAVGAQQHDLHVRPVSGLSLSRPVGFDVIPAEAGIHCRSHATRGYRALRI